MSIQVPYLPEVAIEAEAAKLLAAYDRGRGETAKPPIPADKILELHLGVSFDLDDLPRLLGVENIAKPGDYLGASWVPERRAIIDQSLDPELHPEMAGRYMFTVGHEVGHWHLHARYYLAQAAQRLLFPNTEHPPSIVCRRSQSKTPIEWQADVFSGCLLMPRQMVYEAWQSCYGNLEPRVFDQGECVRLRALGYNMLEADLLDMAVNRCASQFAQQFAVSKQAMRIRLEKLGLVLLGGGARQPQLRGVA